jgi:hypothetical protein
MTVAQAVKYVAGAYLVFGTLLFAYLAIMASKVTRVREEIALLGELLEERER